MYVVVYCGSALHNFILKRVAEGDFNIAQIPMHYLSVSIKSPPFTATHIKKENFGEVGGQVLPLDPSQLHPCYKY